MEPQTEDKAPVVKSCLNCHHAYIRTEKGDLHYDARKHNLGNLYCTLYMLHCSTKMRVFDGRGCNHEALKHWAPIPVDAVQPDEPVGRGEITLRGIGVVLVVILVSIVTRVAAYLLQTVNGWSKSDALIMCGSSMVVPLVLLVILIAAPPKTILNYERKL